MDMNPHDDIIARHDAMLQRILDKGAADMRRRVLAVGGLAVVLELLYSTNALEDKKHAKTDS